MTTSNFNFEIDIEAMRTYSIEAGKDSPFVYLDESKRLVEITGRSTLKEAHWFYSNLLKWLIAFNTGKNRTTTVNINLERVNDSTSKWLTLIFNKFKKIVPDSSFEINWHLKTGSPRIRQCGHLLKSHTGYRVNLLSNHRDY